MERIEQMFHLLLGKIEELKRVNMLNKDIYTTEDLSELTGLTTTRIHVLCSEKKIPYYKQGKRSYFKREEIEKWLTSNYVAMSQEA